MREQIRPWWQDDARGGGTRRTLLAAGARDGTTTVWSFSDLSLLAVLEDDSAQSPVRYPPVRSVHPAHARQAGQYASIDQRWRGRSVGVSPSGTELIVGSADGIVRMQVAASSRANRARACGVVVAQRSRRCQRRPGVSPYREIARWLDVHRH